VAKKTARPASFPVALALPRLLLVCSLVLIALLFLSAQGFKRLHADEMSGLDYIGPVPTVVPLPDLPADASEAEHTAHRMADRLTDLNEPPLSKVVGSPDAEVYRFFYAPTFDPRVCVTIWKEGDLYHMRTVVMSVRPTLTLWGRNETISARKWNRLRSAFTKHSVTDPFNGKDTGGGIDGSSWYLQSLVAGRVTTTQVGSPVDAHGPAHFQIVKARDSQARDFVKTSLLFLDWAGVHVPEMY
jgi:hypothetical protein